MKDRLILKPIVTWANEGKTRSVIIIHSLDVIHRLICIGNDVSETLYPSSGEESALFGPIDRLVAIS
jgi:hypothetical protein